ncbi:SDR family oxidoreductase [Kitasatospora purpeofusca]|uniref:SDR family oxidoreductase n=1 Tax=Kitasatospora purpeofusca TaxID=67352 RepID=UPI002254D13A|nr:NAD(P)H-binding protein [Kitasatospora purpeofusca]MCX4756264.1 NAD(P)H-binding protein [Kitasatospora purpeofusca]WSR35907.1 NAD(P)H-binding protein [Kitasatospora purpeofusca]WSR44217.1 NAD(P)H-binding protein [Kitasatospora purpeofusca]
MIVVTGATGNVGRELVRTLVGAGEQVTAVSRRPGPLPAGVRHVPADLADPESLRPALDGATALFLLVAGEAPQEILRLARSAGVRRVVLLSSQGVGTRPEVYGHAAGFEEAVRESGLDWTVLRSGGLNSNAFAWADSIRADRTAAAPFAEVGLPTVDPADVASVAAATLREDGHTGRTYELTGPAAVTPRERAEAIGAALGTPVRFVEQTRDEARAQLLAFMPEPVVEGTLAILGRPLPAERTPGPDVERILGRAPGTFADWAARTAPAFR